MARPRKLPSRRCTLSARYSSELSVSVRTPWVTQIDMEIAKAYLIHHRVGGIGLRPMDVSGLA